MANFNQQPNKTQAGTNIQEVRQQNAQSAQGGSQGQFGTEFASETNAQQVRQQNANLLKVAHKANLELNLRAKQMHKT